MNNPDKWAMIYEMLCGAVENFKERTGKSLPEMIHNSVRKEFSPYRQDGHAHEELDAIIVDELAILQDQVFLAVDQYINAVGISIRNHNKLINVPYMVSTMSQLFVQVWGGIIGAYLKDSENESVDISVLVDLMKDFQDNQSECCLQILEAGMDKLNVDEESKEKLNKLFALKALSDSLEKLVREASASNDSTGEDETPSRI